MDGMQVRDVNRFLVLSALVALAGGAWARQTDITAQLRALPGVVSVRLSDGRESAPGSYEIAFEQPVDWKAPRGPKFSQRVILHNVAFDAPVLLVTSGYTASPGEAGELRRILGSPNIVTVEHRYFGRSMPSPVRWKYLTVQNAADDMHHIVTSLKKLYHGKWIDTGHSKSGQTALFYKCFFPNDVDATVAYVAPINVAQEDPRIPRYMETVGDADTRERLKSFQIALLKRQDEIMPLLKPNPKDYSIGVAKAYECGVLEVPYAFWQFGVPPSAIPALDAPADEMVRAYNRFGGLYYYSDRGIKEFEAFQYQAFTEIGYYNYDISYLKPYLKADPDPSNLILTPPEARSQIVYNPATMAFVFPFLQYKANHVIYVYGETDAWSATMLPLLGRTDAVKIVVKNAAHNASIRAASPEQKEAVYSALDRWLGLTLNRE